MKGCLATGQGRFFYDFCLEDHVPSDHVLRRIDQVLDLSDVRTQLKPFYSHTGRPSIDPELMIRMLIVGHCFGIRSERRHCDEVHLKLAYRWFWRLRYPITRPSLATAMAGSERAMPSAWCSRASCAVVWMRGWWPRRALPLTPSSSKPMPAAIMASLAMKRSTGPTPGSTHERSASIWRVSVPNPIRSARRPRSSPSPTHALPRPPRPTNECCSAMASII